ncbi:hypothetical protein FPV67DRAFT_868325 [Lyophyllum atratum]|nr:hypothetical protein FPV67DRAFT_868325 [Lyophyllum atratum]
MSTPNRKPYPKSTWRQPPTHFLAIPLNTNPTLRSRVNAFQTHLLQPGAVPDGTRNAPIRGLDKSIMIDPMRFHLTLGVMALDEEAGIEDEKDSTGKADPPHPNAPPPGPLHPSASPTPVPTSPPAERQKPPQPARTVSTALALLRSLGPQIDAILTGGAPETSLPGPTTAAPKLELRVTIDSLNIMRPVKLKPSKPPRTRKLPHSSPNEGTDPQPAAGGTYDGQGTPEATGGGEARPVAEKDTEGDVGGPSVVAGVEGPDPNDVWAEVMYLAPRERGEDRQKLRRIADLVNMTFRREGYVVEKRALKLHVYPSQHLKTTPRPHTRPALLLLRCPALRRPASPWSYTTWPPHHHSDSLDGDKHQNFERGSEFHLDLNLDFDLDHYAQPCPAPEDMPKGACTDLDRLRRRSEQRHGRTRRGAGVVGDGESGSEGGVC